MRIRVRLAIAGITAVVLSACANNEQQKEPGPSLIKNPTFAVADANPDYPLGWTTDAWGRGGDALFEYPVAGVDDAFAATLSVPDTDPDKSDPGAAAWVPAPVPVEGGKIYSFSDQYRSDATSFLLAQWMFADGHEQYDTLATLAPSPGAWQAASVFFAAPIGALKLVMLHQISSAGRLTVDAFDLREKLPPPSGFDQGIVSLTFDDGWESHYTQALPILAEARESGTFFIVTSFVDTDEYVSQKEFSALAAGNEIASHSVSHPHLPELAGDESQAQFSNSKQTLEQWGDEPVGFAYPFGEYDATRMRQAADAGYRYARTTDIGFNTAASAPMSLKSYSVTPTTPFDSVRALIDLAAKYKLWLVLTFHQIDENAASSGDEGYGTTPGELRQIASYLSGLRDRGALKVSTMKEALPLLKGSG